MLNRIRQLFCRHHSKQTIIEKHISNVLYVKVSSICDYCGKEIFGDTERALLDAHHQAAMHEWLMNDKNRMPVNEIVRWIPLNEVIRH